MVNIYWLVTRALRVIGMAMITLPILVHFGSGWAVCMALGLVAFGVSVELGAQE